MATLIFLGCAQVAMAQRCLLIPGSPVAIPAGGSYGFSSVSCGNNLSWTVNGQGTITQQGTYYAPTSVVAQNQDRGCQVSPNNSPYNVPVNTLPVDPHSARWLARVSQDYQGQNSPYHNIKFFPGTVGFYDNVVNNNTPQQPMDFYYTVESNGYQGANFPIPSPRTMMMETGFDMDPGAPYDRHMLTTNNTTCQTTEIYNLYVDFDTVNFTPGNPTTVSWTTSTIWPIPQNYSIYISGGTGAWAAANGNWRLTTTGNNVGTLPFDSSQWGPAPSGTIISSTQSNCNNCNSAAGQKFSPGSYAQLGGVDAAGMPIGSLSAKMEEWYAATQAGRTDLGHAIRTTLSNLYLSSRSTWPATGYASAVSGTTTEITAAQNGNPTILTSATDLSTAQPCANYTYSPGCTFNVNISGITSGPWTGILGDQVATAVNDTQFSINVNSSGFGQFPGGTFLFDFFPYGATIRLMNSVDLNNLCTSTDLNNWCPYAKVYLNTLMNYGMIIADGTIPSDNWDNAVMSSEFHPNVLVDAAHNIDTWSGLQPVENYLQVVNRGSQQLFSDLGDWQDSSVNRTQVCVTGSSGMACTDILLQGTTVGTDHERLLIAANTSYQLNVWVNGNVNTAVTYAINSGVSGATVSSTGLVTMPNCTAKAQGMVTVTSADPNALPLYIEVDCLPVNTDGSYRLALGNYTGDYVDSNNYTWYGSWANNGFDNNYEAPGIGWDTQTGTWQGNGGCQNDTWSGTDPQLYSRSTSLDEDTKVEVVVPNGTYNLTLYGEPGFAGYGSGGTCPTTQGNNVYDWIIQGQTQGSWLDGYVLAGNQNWVGYTLTAPATVTDNVLDTIGRIRAISTYGMSWSSLEISPSGGPPALTITTTSLPNGYWVVPYIATVSAIGGTPPYTWSLVPGQGLLPPGYQLNPSTGVIAGHTPLSGTFSFTVQVTDSAQNTATQPLSIDVCRPGHC